MLLLKCLGMGVLELHLANLGHHHQPHHCQVSVQWCSRPLLQPPAHVVEVLTRGAQHRRLPQAQAGEAVEYGTEKISCLVNPKVI